MLALTLLGPRRAGGQQVDSIFNQIENLLTFGSHGLGNLGAYTCPGNVCVPSDSGSDALFRRLQAVANDAARKLGIGGPITVDGKIGPATVAKVYMVSVAMPARPDLVFLTTMDGQTRPGAVAASAVRIVDELEALISGEIQMPTHDVGPIDPYPVAISPPGMTPPRPQTPVATAPGVPGAGPHVTTSATPMFTAPPLAAKVALGAIALGLVGVVLYRRRKRAAVVSGARRRRRR